MQPKSCEFLNKQVINGRAIPSARPLEQEYVLQTAELHKISKELIKTTDSISVVTD